MPRTWPVAQNLPMGLMQRMIFEDAGKNLEVFVAILIYAGLICRCWVVQCGLWLFVPGLRSMLCKQWHGQW